MKKIIIIIASVFILNVNSYTQITHFGLEGIKVNALKLHGSTLYAATSDSGVFSRNIHDTQWVSLGLRGKIITSVYPHPVNLHGFSLTVGVWTSGYSSDTTVIYSLSQHGWVPDDSGMHGQPGIASINGITTDNGSQIMFAGSEGLYRRSNQIWEFIFDQGIGIIKTSPIGEIWIGGESALMLPYICKSTDNGDSWTLIYYSYEGFFCNEIDFHPTDPNVVYAIPLGIIKTTDGGLNWQNLDQYGYRLAVDPFDGNHVFSGGWDGNSMFRLYETRNGGINWDSIPSPINAKGIFDLEINLTDSIELYIATHGTGVYRLTQPSSACGRMISVNSGWNMLSIPNKVNDFKKTSIFPSSISDAFTYQGIYSPDDTLQIGTGYWLKFYAPNYFNLIGEKIVRDTFNVNAGWNMIGSISYPVLVSSIRSDPPEMVTTNFFTYKNDQYVISDTINPGIAYWVKTNQSGKLILDTITTQNYKLSSSTLSAIGGGHIKIIPDGELPPVPPDFEIRNHPTKRDEIPTKFTLHQNYPNPFNPIAIIEYDLPEECYVTLNIYDILGEEVITLIDEIQDAGFKSVRWDASVLGGGMPSGVYLYRLSAGKFTDVKKMVVVR